jgi:peptide/nickel transport system substrate-binding protein
MGQSLVDVSQRAVLTARDSDSNIISELHEQLLEDLPFLWIVKTESSRIFTQRCSGFSPAGHFAETASVRSSAGPG